LIPSLFASVLKNALFSTNPYNNFLSANSKEYIALDKGSKQDFRPKTCFNIIPGNSDAFSAEIKKYSAQFGYGSFLNVPSNRDVDAADANVITYNQPINMIKTWNKVTDDIIAKNANEVWGGVLMTELFPLSRKSTNCLQCVAKLEQLQFLPNLARRNSLNARNLPSLPIMSWHC
jgi:hypothetical protein